jgi:hypothetical protein
LFCMNEIINTYENISINKINKKFNISVTIESINKAFLDLYPIRKTFGYNYSELSTLG